MAITRCHILRLKCSKIDFFQLILERLQTLPQTSYLDLRGPTYKGGKEEKGPSHRERFCRRHYYLLLCTVDFVMNINVKCEFLSRLLNLKNGMTLTDYQGMRYKLVCIFVPRIPCCLDKAKPLSERPW